MQKEAIARFSALSLSAGLAYAGYIDIIPVDTKRPDSELAQMKHENKQRAYTFLTLCEKNGMVTSKQQLERESTYGGQKELDAYTDAFEKYVKS